MGGAGSGGVRLRRLRSRLPGPFALGLMTALAVAAAIVLAVVAAALVVLVTLPLWFPFVMLKTGRPRRDRGDDAARDDP